MGLHRDDLDGWASDPVVQALQQPGSRQELGGFDPVLAEFRTAVPASSGVLRIAHRLGTGATTVIVAIGLTGGVAAAAYTRTLPAPLQSAMHSLLGPVGVPAAEPQAPRIHPVAGPGTATTRHPAHPASQPFVPSQPRAASPGPAPAGRPAAPVPAATPTATSAPSAAAVAPTASPSSPAATPSPSSSAAAPPPAPPATLTAHAARVRVPYSQRLGVRGTLLTSSGAPVAGHRVFLQQRPHGTQQWQRVAAGRTRPDGTIVLRTPELTRNIDVRMVTPQALHSTVTVVKVLPRLTVSLQKSPNGKRYVVTVEVAGAQSGDTVTLARGSDGNWTRVATKQLPDSATLTFSVPVPTADVRYRVRAVATQVHADGYAVFTAVAG